MAVCLQNTHNSVVLVIESENVSSLYIDDDYIKKHIDRLSCDIKLVIKDSNIDRIFIMANIDKLVIDCSKVSDLFLFFENNASLVIKQSFINDILINTPPLKLSIAFSKIKNITDNMKFSIEYLQLFHSHIKYITGIYIEKLSLYKSISNVITPFIGCYVYDEVKNVIGLNRTLQISSNNEYIHTIHTDDISSVAINYMLNLGI